MAVPSVSPSAWQIRDTSVWNGLLDSIQKGMMIGAMPAQNKADLQYKQAQAQREQAMANLPFGGQTLPGPAGQVLGLETMRQMFGEKSPQYQMALQNYNLGQQSDLARINYQNVLSNTLPVRSLTPLGKGDIEENNVNRGLDPTGRPWPNSAPPTNTPNNPSGAPNSPGSIPTNPDNDTPPTNASPGSPADMAEAYKQKRLRDTTDASSRQKSLYATNIDKTLEQIDPDVLTQYSGPQGNAKKLYHIGLSLEGKTPDEYQKFQNNITAADMLATQVRQFYGDSIQPDMIKRLQFITNPSSFLTSPDIAKSKFLKTKDILNKETQTYRDSLKTTKVYKDQPQQLPLSNNEVQALKNTMGGGQIPAQQGVAPQPQISAKQAQLMQMAQKAIANKKNPELVKKRLQELMAGGQ